MSSANSHDPSQISSPAPKKKNNKKKKSGKVKSNGDAVQAPEPETPTGNGDGDGEDSDHDVNTPQDGKFPEIDRPQTNGHNSQSNSNGHLAGKVSEETKSRESDGTEEKASDTADASIRFEAMSQEREALRAEVEQLRKSLEDIQGKHKQEISTLKSQHLEQISKTTEKYSEEVSTVKSQLTEELSTVQAELEESETAKELAETQYQNLLGRVGTIKSSLAERLDADKERLLEANSQIKDLESQNEVLQKRLHQFESEIKELKEEARDSSKELSSLRNRHNLSQQNWVHERDDLVQQAKHLREEAEAAKEAMGDWEVLAMEERSMREGLTERIADIEEQFSVQKEAYEGLIAERDSQSQTVDGLQRALRELQEARKVELREMVESYEEQIQKLKKLVQESDSRAAEAEASMGALQAEVDRVAPFEKEVKEKSLLIGKLRHEAIVLNDHLTKALRFLKKAKPEDNIDRQIVTNHFLQFLALDRSDPKKFQILQLIAALLNWTEEQKEQSGLSRPGTSSGSLRLPMSPFHRTPSTPSLSSELFEPPSATRESLADLWTGFLERSAEEGREGSIAGSRSGSMSGAPRPNSKGADVSLKE